jgi:hypothetical protein
MDRRTETWKRTAELMTGAAADVPVAGRSPLKIARADGIILPELPVPSPYLVDEGEDA